jgi:hypothetical protein
MGRGAVTNTVKHVKVLAYTSVIQISRTHTSQIEKTHKKEKSIGDGEVNPVGSGHRRRSQHRDKLESALWAAKQWKPVWKGRSAAASIHVKDLS